MRTLPRFPDDAHRAGRRAYFADAASTSNPFPKGGELHNAWRRGWLEAAADTILRGRDLD